MFSASGAISDRLRRLLSPSDPSWNYRSPTESTPMPKTGVTGKKLGGKAGRTTK